MTFNFKGLNCQGGWGECLPSSSLPSKFKLKVKVLSKAALIGGSFILGKSFLILMVSSVNCNAEKLKTGVTAATLQPEQFL